MMRLRKTIANTLYEIASAICQFADALTPSSDEVWRERQWERWGRDFAKRMDGPPLTEDGHPYSRGVCFMDNGPCPNVPYCPLVCERSMPKPTGHIKLPADDD